MGKYYDALMVGAGLFNAVLTAKLVERGKSVLVIDRRKEIGGNCATYEDDGITVHKYGAHIFHTSKPDIWNFANRYALFYPFVNSPIAKVLRNGKAEVYNLPFNMNTFSKLWGCTSPEKAMELIYMKREPYQKETYSNLEEKALSLVGEEIYELFIKHYTEKQWGCKCTELSPDIIKRIPLRFTYDNNYFDDIWQGIPEGGYTRWIEKMLSGATVLLGADYIPSREKWDSMAGMVFYSGMLDELFDYELGELPYRSLEFSITKPDVHDFQGVAVVNHTTDKSPFTRTIEHKHFMTWNKRILEDCHTILTYEYPKEFSRGGEAYYPVVNEDSKKLYTEYYKMLPSKVYATGRLGRFEYNDMDVTIAKALDSAKYLLDV